MINVDEIEASILVPAPPSPRPARPRGAVGQRMTRARSYLAKMDPAIQGQNGSGSLWQTVCRLMHGFHLDDGEVRELILGDYNDRCDPPWSDAEIDHKIRDARNKVDPAPWSIDDRQIAVVDELVRAPVIETSSADTGPASSGERGTLTPIGRSIAEIFGELYRRKDEPTVHLTLAGIEIAELDPDSMAVIIGGPGRGKTSLALALASHHARRVGPVVIVSVELLGRQLGARMLGAYDAASWREALRGSVSRERADELASHLVKLRVLDGDAANIESARGAIQQLRSIRASQSSSSSTTRRSCGLRAGRVGKFASESRRRSRHARVSAETSTSR